jgi:uncharacterized protein YcaQ
MNHSSELVITQQQARRLQIHSLGLGAELAETVTKVNLLEEIIRMGVLQIDTINIVARSQYIVLWSRLGSYPLNWLDELIAEKHLFEYWAHAACYIPMKDYPLYQWKVTSHRKKAEDNDTWLGQNFNFVNEILHGIRKNGPVKSSNFKRKDGLKGSWWNWKDEKIALEHLLLVGELMVAKRDQFQRVYDLTERVHPKWSAEAYSEADAKNILTARTIKSLGIALPQWIPDYYRLPKSKQESVLGSLVESGEILHVNLEGFESAGYIHKDNMKLYESIVSGSTNSDRTVILSPFDPLLWDRTRLKTLFGFDFRLECYLPASKRKFGYWLLPILHNDSIIGKMDVKADRKNKVLEIKSIFLEDGVKVTEGLLDGLSRTIHNFANWHNTPVINLHYSNHPTLISNLEMKLHRITR